MSIALDTASDLVAYGASAIQHDDPTTNTEGVGWNDGDPTQSGCYCSFCMKGRLLLMMMLVMLMMLMMLLMLMLMLLMLLLLQQTQPCHRAHGKHTHLLPLSTPCSSYSSRFLVPRASLRVH